MSSDKFAQWWQWDDVQTSTICKPKRIRLFALIINCTIIMKTNSRRSRNVYAIGDRIWCNKHLRHTTTEKYDNNGKGGYFRFDDDNNMSYRYILSITCTEMGQLITYNHNRASDRIQFLGLAINEFMNWNSHASKIPNKISRTLGVMNRLKRYLPLSAMKLMYCSLILSHLQFVITSWGLEWERLS